jgi:hypothetical protein
MSSVTRDANDGIFRPTDRDVVAVLVQSSEDAYHTDKSPLLAWHAYLECRRVHLASLIGYYRKSTNWSGPH